MAHERTDYGGPADPNTGKVLAHLAALSHSGFWGAVKIKFEAGRAVHILQEESLIPARLTENPRKLDYANSTK